MRDDLVNNGHQYTPLGTLPAGWRCLQLRDVVSESRKVTYGIVQPGEYDSKGVLLIRGQDYIKGWAEPDAFFRVSRTLHNAYKRSSTVAGDLLICIVGATTGATNVVPIWISEANITQTTARVACDPRKVDSQFALFSLASEFGQMQVRKYIKGSAQPGLNLADVERFYIPAAPLHEQRKIARILTTVDNLIEKTEALIAKYQSIKQGMMHDLFTRGVDAHGQLRPPYAQAPELYKQSELGWIPNEWEVHLLDTVATRGSGHTPNKLIDKYWNGGVKWVSLADSDKLDNLYIADSDKHISELGLANSSAVRHRPGTVILSRDAGIGKSAIITDTMAVSQHFMAWFCGPRLLNVFLYYWLQHEKPKFEAIAMGSTIKTIGLSYFKKLPIALPPLREQEIAKESLLAVEHRLFGLADELRKYSVQKTGLMQDLLTGKVRVAVDELDEVA